VGFCANDIEANSALFMQWKPLSEVYPEFYQSSTKKIIVFSWFKQDPGHDFFNAP